MADRHGELTFFVWADTHFGYEQTLGSQDLRWRVIEQMKHLAGWPYPPSVGGVVGKPDFVVHCGDMVDGNAESEREMQFFSYFMDRLPFERFEVLGNHDAAPCIQKYFVERYGATSHAFVRGGTRFVSLNTSYDDASGIRVPESDLAILTEAARQESELPIVLFVHVRLDRIENRSDVVAALRGRPVILVMGAHVHKPAVFKLDGMDCVDVGQCRNHPIDPEYGRNFYVVRIKDGELAAVPWRWDLEDWERGDRWAVPEETVKRFTLVKAI